MAAKPTTRNIIQYLAIFLILVVLPAGSWFYLRSGLDYRIKAMESLKDYGKIPSFEWHTLSGEPLGHQDLHGKLVLAQFVSLGNEELKTAFGRQLGKLHEQFDERPDLLFLTFLTDADTSAAWQSFASAHELNDPSQVYFLATDPAVLDLVAREGFRLPLTPEQSLAESPYFVFADTSLTMRHYYDVHNDADIRQLVAHIAMLLPQIKERELIFKRETEK